jgi:anthranilate phosphoribosyltransferase
MAKETQLKEFGATIQKLINKHDLTRDESYSAFREILTGTQPDLHQGAFLSALVSKGETAEEIAGAWQAICEFDTVDLDLDVPNLVENSGTGMDSLKTFNVSSAAAVVASSCGATLARHGARALTSFCGTVDILEAVGIGVETDVSVVEDSIRSEGIGLFNGMSPKVHPSALGRILSQIRFGSTLNIAASLANPARPSLALRGVYSESMIPLAAEVMSEIGYTRALVVHGRDDVHDGGMDELSITGETSVLEFKNDKTETWTLRPEDVGMKTAQFEDIATTGNLEEEACRFVRVLAGAGDDGCIDFTCINAGAILYISDIAPTIRSGIELAKQAIADGSAIAKLQSWVHTQNEDPHDGAERLSQVMNKAQLK